MNHQSLSAQLLGLRVALVHYWYVRQRGGERVLDVLAEMFPQADIFVLLYDPAALSDAVRGHRVRASFIQKLPWAKKCYPALLPLFPLALEQLRLDDYDLVISHEAGPAKGIITRAATCHLCYCHTPMRYLWDMYHSHRRAAPLGAMGRSLYALAAHYLRQWDYLSAARVDDFAASSQNGASRIRKYYRRTSEVIYPPVDVSAFTPAESHEDFYLVISPLVPYKRVDLAIAACNLLSRPLVIIGEGPMRKSLEKTAGPTIRFLGYQPGAVVRDHYRHCRAFLFSGEEDIGLTPIEAQASGRPVIAFGHGGALETVIGAFSHTKDLERATGLFFDEPTPQSLADAILRFEAVEDRFSSSFIRAHAEQFDKRHFVARMGDFVSRKLAEHRATTHLPETRWAYTSR